MTTETNRKNEALVKSEVAAEDTRPGLVSRPDVDILEDADAYVILADMPGVNEGDVDIQLDKGVLALDASAPNAEGAPATRHAEYRSGGYHREFRVSERIDAEAVTAKMQNGVLVLRLPKTAESRPRRIEVQAA